LVEGLRERLAEVGIGCLYDCRISIRLDQYARERRSQAVDVTLESVLKPLKRLQRSLMALLLDKLPIHEAATAYRRGFSILDNAKPHAANSPILKLDLKNFFPSIRSHDWELYCKRNKCLVDEEEIYLTSQLLFRRDPNHRSLRLAIGAPSSPMLSNILMFEFDTLVTAFVEEENVTYTRYADDLTFSAPRTGYLTGVKRAVCKIIRDLKSPVLDLNDEKTTYITKKYHRSVTGLIISNDGKVTLGRDRKRLISATLHRAVLGKLSGPERQMLAGTLAYVNAVEPVFLDILKKKYGAKSVEDAQHHILKGTKLEVHKPPIATVQKYNSEK
jgi:hypothetical protein